MLLPMQLGAAKIANLLRWWESCWNRYLVDTFGTNYYTRRSRKAGGFQSVGFGCHMRTSCYHPAMKHGVIENPMKLSHRTKPPFTSGISHTVDGCEILHHQPDGWSLYIMGCLPPINWCRISQPSTVCHGFYPWVSPFLLGFPMVFMVFPMVFLWVFHPKSHCLQDICWVKTNRLAPLDARGSVKSGSAGSNWSIELTEESYFWYI